MVFKTIRSTSKVDGMILNHSVHFKVKLLKWTESSPNSGHCGKIGETGAFHFEGLKSPFIIHCWYLDTIPSCACYVFTVCSFIGAHKKEYEHIATCKNKETKLFPTRTVTVRSARKKKLYVHVQYPLPSYRHGHFGHNGDWKYPTSVGVIFKWAIATQLGTPLDKETLYLNFYISLFKVLKSWSFWMSCLRQGLLPTYSPHL